jgi:predicted nucleic acid-binding protein
MNDNTKVVFPSKPTSANVSLDTLAQLRKYNDEGEIRLQKRARSKYVQESLILSLVDIAFAEGDEVSRKSYWNTYHCANELIQEGDNIRGQYCNNRLCLVCSRIRTGKLINKYQSAFEKMKEPYFITLTTPSVKKEELRNNILKMQSTLKGIQEVMRKRGTRLIGIRKLESNHNLLEDTYNPHFHLLIEGEYESYVLVDEWMKRNPKCNQRAQFLRPSEPDDLKETFKYTTKLATKEGIDNNGKPNKKPISPIALHEIFKAFRNVRVFQNIGNFGKVNTEENDDDINVKTIENYTHVPYANVTTKWRWEKYDWINKGNYLSNYQPSEAIEEFRNKTKQQCNAPNVIQNSPQRMSNTNIVQTSVDNEHFIPVKEAHKRTYKRPPQRVTQTTIQV